MEKFVRLTSIELNNFKNVEHGEIKLSNYQSTEVKGEINNSDVIGVYGQNGSGKTAIVEALDIVKNLISGKPASYTEYSGIINKEASLTFTFFIQSDNKKYKAQYSVKLGTYEKIISVPWEKLTLWERGAGWKKESFVEINNPYYELDSLTNDAHATVSKKIDYDFVENPDKLAVSCASKGISFLFNLSVQKMLDDSNPKSSLATIIKMLITFANENFFIIKVSQLAQINSKTILPLNVKDQDKGYMVYGCIPLFLNGSGTIPKKIYETLDSIMETINTALCAIIPDLKIDYNKVGEETDPNGLELVQIDMFSLRGGRRFSTKYESEGIKRIISLLSCLVSVFNNRGTTLVVDELDSGIFEYLLGELLYAVEKNARGQLIFTSHNLRAFEKLPNESIVCSTTNPSNRYVRLVGINRNNNKRDFYIRALALGGQKEELYDGDDLDNIGYAFRKAGRICEVK